MPNTQNECVEHMNIEPKIIKSAAEYRTYLAEVERLATHDPAPGTPDGDRLELLAMLVEDYEEQHFNFERPDPIDAIRFRMEQKGLRQKDLIPILGGKNRVSEVLCRKRPLTVYMIRALNKALNIPAELLIREPEPPPYGTPLKRSRGSVKTSERLRVYRQKRPKRA